MDRSLMSRATSSDDAPTPAYLYNEIAKATTQSYDVSQKIQEFLMTRLKKKNANVKYKCLVIIKNCCRMGRADFKRDMQRNTDAIKECLRECTSPTFAATTHHRCL